MQTRVALPQNKILGINGSPRKNGNSDILLDAFIQGVNEVKNENVSLRDLDSVSCIGCERYKKDKIFLY